MRDLHSRAPDPNAALRERVDVVVTDAERLAALGRTGLLDAPPEPAFDRLTRLAARLLNAPVGLVTLVDEDRQFFLSAHGVPEPLASERGTPLSYSFCKYVVAANEPIIIEDSRKHSLVWDNPATIERNTLAYIGIPLQTPDGYTIGSLCVADIRPRQWTRDEVLAMQDLCDLAARELVVREQLRERTHFAERLGEISPAVTYLFDVVEQRILHISDNVQELLGYSADEIEGFGSEFLTTLMHPEDLARFPMQMAALTDLAPGKSTGFQYRMRHMDGSWRWLYGRDIVYDKGEGGVPRRILGSALDVTQLKESEALEEARKKADALSRGVFENSADCIKLLNLEGELVSMNTPGLRLFEADSFEPWRGVNWLSLWKGDDGEAAQRAFASACAGGQGRFQGKCPTAKGTLKWWDVIISPIVRADAAPEQLLAISRDITSLKMAEDILRESESRSADQKQALALAVSGAPIQKVLDVLVRAGQRRFGSDARTAISIVDSESACLRFSVTAGLDEEYTRGVEKLGIGPEYPPCGLAVHTAQLVVARDVAEDPLWAPYADLAQKHGIRACWSFPICSSNGEVVGTFAVYHRAPREPETRDLERIKLLAQTAAVIIERHKVQEALAAAKEQAEAASRAKDRFLATLSHELRTPLNPVLLTATETLRDPALTGEAREAWEVVRKNVALEAQLIDDLLDLTRIGHGKMALTVSEVDAHAVLRDALQTVRPEVEKKRISLVLEIEARKPLVRGDAVRLQQVFWNILNNAAKFTPNNGLLTVRTRDGANGVLLVDVADTGIGMTEEELGRLFVGFAQGDHANGGGSRVFGGLGLGMTISRQIVEMHGGTIRAESAGRGHGSVFTVELPILEAALTEAPGPFRSPADAMSALEPLRVVLGAEPVAGRKAPLRLLLVEDHEATRVTLTALLLRRGYEVMSAATVSEARAFARQRQFDLVVSDIGLEDGDGYTLMAELRDALGSSLRGIAMSGYGMPEDVARSREAGFSIHLTKPVDISVLDAALGEISRAVDMRAL